MSGKITHEGIVKVVSKNEAIITSYASGLSQGKDRKPDADGYWDVPLSTFEVFNSVGEYYPYDAEHIANLINNEAKSPFARKLLGGYLTGEMDHPELNTDLGHLPEPVRQAEIRKQFVRNITVPMENESHHIKDIRLVVSNEPSEIPGRGNIVYVYGKVKPVGVHGKLLLEQLMNPEINVAFSIRCTTDSVKIGNVWFKTITHIITWDWVREPGLKRVNMWNSTINKIGRECRVEEIVGVYDLDVIGNITSNIGISVESAMTSNEIVDYLKQYKATNNSTVVNSILDGL